MLRKRGRFNKCICGHVKHKIVHKGSWIDQEGKLNFSIFQCLKCGLLRTFPKPGKTTITTEDIEHRLENLQLWQFFGQNLIQLIKKYKKGKIKLLDVGCNIGILVKLSKENHWQAVGIDVDNKVVELGRKRFGVDLRWTNLENAIFKSNEFDVVTLSHTLEHIFNPRTLILEIRRILKKGGIIVIEVPNIESLPAKLQNIRRESWYGYDPRHHLWHFTAKTLSQLINDCGFDILEVKTSRPLYYEKTGSFWDIPRGLILRVSGFLGLADQITLVAKL